MKTTYHPSSERGHANHGWLNSYHSFSFADWYNPLKINFGALRVLNDDTVKGGEGFGTHPHSNMEIVSIPLKGTLAHKDSTGTEQTIVVGDVQIMSAGTGIRHSEYNASKTEEVKFLQIWVFPKEEDISPRYDQAAFNETDRKNRWQLLVSPDKKDGSLWINQNAFFSRTLADVGSTLSYANKLKENGVYLFVVEGSIEVNGQVLYARDAIGVSEAEQFDIKVLEKADILAIEIPMYKL